LVLKNPNVSVAILGVAKASQVTENAKFLDLLPKVSDSVMQEIEDILENRPKCLWRRSDLHLVLR